MASNGPVESGEEPGEEAIFHTGSSGNRSQIDPSAASLRAPRLLPGTTFPMSLIEMGRYRARYFDEETGMATFSISDIRFDRLGCVDEEDLPVSSVLVACQLIHDALYRMDLFNDNPKGWTESIGVAGSSALLLVEAILSKDDDGWRRGRWLDKRTYWKANDVDLFVGGANGATPEAFERFARNFVRTIRNVADEYDYNVCHVDDYRHNYIHEGLVVHIVDIGFREFFGLTVSLVQSPVSTSMKEVVDNFDIDVAKVMYNPCTGLAHTRLETLPAIWEGSAVVRNFELSPGYPTRFEVNRVASTLRRMEKYGQRGYNFSEYMSLSTGNIEEGGSEEEEEG